jgi:hypothetical protein
MESETRFAMLARSHPEDAQRFLQQAQKEAERRFKAYQEMAEGLADKRFQRREPNMIDLSTDYLGLKLKNPLVPSASPLSKSIDTALRLEDAGAAALVMYSLFEEELHAEDAMLDRFLLHASLGHGEADGFPAGSERISGRARALSGTTAPAQAPSGNPGGGEPQRRVAVGLGGTRARTRAGRRRCAGAQRLSRRRRCQASGRVVEDRYVELLTELRARSACRSR